MLLHLLAALNAVFMKNAQLCLLPATLQPVQNPGSIQGGPQA
jgi:hypothetical protein